MTFSAVLIGGPVDLPRDNRVQRLSSVVDLLRCEYGAGYECFRFLGERMAFDPNVVVYEWSHRESPAEARQNG
jgi:hypothetical protein